MSGVNEIIAEEYLKNAKSPEDIRDAFTEILGDLFMVIPSITVASYHRGWLWFHWQYFTISDVLLLVCFIIFHYPNFTDAGVPVYMYEFQHRPSIFKDLRPSFVKADHGDELGFVFGACFWDGHIKVGM